MTAPTALEAQPATASSKQLLGAVGRAAVGRWSDLIGSRMRPVRLIAATSAVMLLALALLDQKASAGAVSLMIAVSVVAVLDNGLEATAITGFAGPTWSGGEQGSESSD